VGEDAFLNQAGKKHLAGNKLSRSGRAGLSFVCETGEIVFKVASFDPHNTGNSVVGFCQPGEKLL